MGITRVPPGVAGVAGVDGVDEATDSGGERAQAGGSCCFC